MSYNNTKFIPNDVESYEEALKMPQKIIDSAHEQALSVNTLIKLIRKLSLRYQGGVDLLPVDEECSEMELSSFLLSCHVHKLIEIISDDGMFNRDNNPRLPEDMTPFYDVECLEKWESLNLDNITPDGIFRGSFIVEQENGNEAIITSELVFWYDPGINTIHVVKSHEDSKTLGYIFKNQKEKTYHLFCISEGSKFYEVALKEKVTEIIDMGQHIYLLKDKKGKWSLFDYMHKDKAISEGVEVGYDSIFRDRNSMNPNILFFSFKGNKGLGLLDQGHIKTIAKFDSIEEPQDGICIMKGEAGFNALYRSDMFDKNGIPEFLFPKFLPKVPSQSFIKRQINRRNKPSSKK